MLRFLALAAVLVACRTTTTRPPVSTESRVGSDLCARLRFLEQAEASAFLAAADDFTQALSAFDRALRLRRAAPVSDAELREHAAAQALAFTAAEEALWREACAVVASVGLALPLPDEVVLLKTTGRDELGDAYTRRNGIILSAPVAGRGSVGLLAHELFHVATRHSRALRDSAYALLGFAPVPRAVEAPALEATRLTNPDAARAEHFIELRVGASERPMVPLLVMGRPLEAVLALESPFSALRIVLIEVDPQTALVKTSCAGPCTVDAGESDWAARLAKNTDYAIHPEEVLADNFALLVKARSGGKVELTHPQLLEQLAAVLRGVSR